MAEIRQEKLPPVSDQEIEGLKKIPSSDSIEMTDADNLAGAVVDGVPRPTKVNKGAIQGEYVIKDDLLIFHFHKSDRK